MSFFCKTMKHLMFPISILVICNQVGTKETYNEGFIGSPKVAVDLPEELRRLCQDGWVDVSYDVNEAGEIVNVHILRSEPDGMFDQYALDAFKKLKPAISRAKSAGLQGVIHRFTISSKDSCAYSGERKQ